MPHGYMTARKRVMIISHGKRFGLALADRMAAEGYEVTIAQHADDAIEQLSVAQPDGIVLDLHLPIANGLEVLRLIRGQCPEVPVFTMMEPARAADPELAVSVAGAEVRLQPFEPPLMATLLNARVRTAPDCGS